LLRHHCQEVGRDLLRLNPGRADDLSRKSAGYWYLPHWCGLFQIGEFCDPTAPAALWAAKRIWDPIPTDICLVEAVPDGQIATERLNRSRTLFPE
jgi:hypothetical protein